MANLPISPMKYMPNLLHVAPTWAEDEGVVYMIVEILKGTISKYELITETGQLKLDRVGYSSLAYPCTYGAIPMTMDGDGDALDIILPDTTEPLIPGCLLEARVIGLMEMIDGGEVDNKVIAVPHNDRRFDHINDLKDLSEQFIKETRYYFEHYKDLKKPGTVEIKDFLGKEDAIKIIKETESVYKKDYLPLLKD